MSTSTFKLEIQTREGILFSEDVQSITAYNRNGRFDILPGHINYISIIEKELVIRQIGKDQKSFKLFTGLLQFLNNNAKVFLGFTK